MKVVVIVALMFVSTLGKAQESMISKPYEYVKSFITDDLHKTFLASGINNAGTNYYISYELTQDAEQVFYFSKQTNICLAYMEILSKFLLIDAIAELNKNHIKIDDNTWVSKNNEIQVVLRIDGDRVVISHSKINDNLKVTN